MTQNTDMVLGVIGVGRMGGSRVRRLMDDGHTAVVHDIDPSGLATPAAEGSVGVDSEADLAANLSAPRAVWVVVPAERITQAVIGGWTAAYANKVVSAMRAQFGGHHEKAR
jgi:6-phosphogluconate dehydrogenase